MPTPVEVSIPTFLQVLGVLNVYFIKPTYMLMSAYLLKRLWRYGEPELRWLWWGLLAFLVGEGACAVNYGVCDMQSVPWEMVHNVGMVIAIGFLNMGALEVVDRRMVFQFVQGKACALMRFCRECPLRAGDGARACRFKPLFVLASLAGAFFSAMPLTRPILDHPMTTQVFGFRYQDYHLPVYQWFDSRLCSAAGVALFLLTFALLLVRKDPFIRLERWLFSFAIAFGGFGVIRFLNYRANWDIPIWFDFWEEAAEWITIFGMAATLWLLRAQLFEDGTDKPPAGA